MNGTELMPWQMLTLLIIILLVGNRMQETICQINYRRQFCFKPNQYVENDLLSTLYRHQEFQNFLFPGLFTTRS